MPMGYDRPRFGRRKDDRDVTIARLALVSAFCGLLTLAARFAFAEPLSDHDTSPFTGIFGLPDATEGAVLPQGRSQWDVLLQTASHSVADAGGDELLIVDGETSRLEVRFRRAVGERWEIGAELPYLTHQAGGLDSVIDGWHEFFGLPDGARDSRPTDELEFRYRVDGASTVDEQRSTNGFGDLRLIGGYRLADTERWRSALRFGLKLPTGDAGKLHGSGSVDVSVGLAGNHDQLGSSGRWSAFWRLHAVWLGEPKYLSRIYEEFVLTGAGGVSWQASPSFGLTVQASGRSALYDSQVDAIGEPAFALIVGAHVRFAERWRLEIAVGEDIKVESTPDVTFQLAVRYRPE